MMNHFHRDLSDLTLFDHEDLGFTFDQVNDLFPKAISTNFEVASQKEADLLYGLITNDPFLVPATFLNPLLDCRVRPGKQISASVQVDEGFELNSSPDYFLMHYPEVEAELLLSQSTSNK